MHLTIYSALDSTIYSNLLVGYVSGVGLDFVEEFVRWVEDDEVAIRERGSVDYDGNYNLMDTRRLRWNCRKAEATNSDFYFGFVCDPSLATLIKLRWNDYFV